MTDEKTDSFITPVPSPHSDQDALLQPGSELGKYEIIGFLAEGGMGVVYRARHKILQSQHAIKVIRSTFATQPEFVSRFRREARIMAALDHPNIVRVTDFGDAEDRYFYVMDFVAGPEDKPRTLEDEITDVLAKAKKGGKKGSSKKAKTGLPQRRVREIGIQICDALIYAHNFGKEGVAHLDLKPSNIMILGQSSTRGVHTAIKVTDFGFAKILDRDSILTSVAWSQTSTKDSSQAMIAGTPRYMSPEQWKGETEAGPASDIYSLGNILYEALVGKVPQEVYPARTPSSFGWASDWDRIIERCLRNEPERRYPSAEKLRSDLQRIQFIRPMSRKRRRAPKVIAAVVLCALLAGAGAALYYFGYIDQDNINTTKSFARVLFERGKKKINVFLKPPGFLNVRSDAGVDIAVVSEDGETLVSGTTDIYGHKTGIRLSEGIYDVVLTCENYFPITNRVVIIPGEIKTLDRKFAVGPAWTRRRQKKKGPTLGQEATPGKIRIICNVDDALIYKEGERIGRIGEVLSLAAFIKHDLQIRAPGYKPSQITVRLSSPGKHEKDQYVELSEWDAALRVTAATPDGYSKRPKAEILIDGESIGTHTLPLVWDKDLKPGRHTVAIAERPWKPTPPQEVNVIKGKPTDVHFFLQELDSYLEFDITPPGAAIYVDGRSRKTTRVKVRPHVDHEVRIWAKNHVAYTDTLSVSLGKTNKITVTLQKKKRKRTIF